MSAENKKISFYNVVEAIAIKNLQLENPNMSIFRKSGSLTLGIFFPLIGKLILVAGISIIISGGLRATSSSLEYFVFNLFLWFYFAETAQSSINMKPDINHLSFEGNDFTSFHAAHFLKLITYNFIVLIILTFIIFFLGFEVFFYNLFIAFLLLSSLATFYGIIMSAILFGKQFLIELHQFVMLAGLFLSSIFISIPQLPESIGKYLLLNPVVHIMEFIKSPYTGIYYESIDITYPIKVIAVLAFIFAPFFIYKKIKYYEVN